jgi:hypothetical protein
VDLLGLSVGLVRVSGCVGASILKEIQNQLLVFPAELRAKAIG